MYVVIDYIYIDEMMMMRTLKNSSVERWILQRSNKNEENGASNGRERGGGDAAEKPAAERAV